MDIVLGVKPQRKGRPSSWGLEDLLNFFFIHMRQNGPAGKLEIHCIDLLRPQNLNLYLSSVTCVAELQQMCKLSAASVSETSSTCVNTKFVSLAKQLNLTVSLVCCLLTNTKSQDSKSAELGNQLV